MAGAFRDIGGWRKPLMGTVPAVVASAVISEPVVVKPAPVPSKGPEYIVIGRHQKCVAKQGDEYECHHCGNKDPRRILEATKCGI